MYRRTARDRSRSRGPPMGSRPYFFADNRWITVPTASPILKPLPRQKPIEIYTWNIDFQRSHAVSRMNGAIDHLRDHLPTTSPGLLPPTVILFQEICDDSLTALLRHSWVRNNFQISDIVPPGARGYFTMTLVSLPLHVAQILRCPFHGSSMGRDVLLADILLEGGGVLRAGSTHLESLPIGEPQRPIQLRTIASLLREPGVVTGIVGGDMNAISPGDQDLPSKPGIQLSDTWELEPMQGTRTGMFGLGQGHTWGYQPPSRFPPGRLDKLLYTGNASFACMKGESLLRRVGVNVEFKVSRDDPDGPYLPSHDERWITDHFGLAVTMLVN